MNVNPKIHHQLISNQSMLNQNLHTRDKSTGTVKSMEKVFSKIKEFTGKVFDTAVTKINSQL
jgi:hypothetical protein